MHTRTYQAPEILSQLNYLPRVFFDWYNSQVFAMPSTMAMSFLALRAVLLLALATIVMSQQYAGDVIPNTRKLVKPHLETTAHCRCSSISTGIEARIL